MVSFDFSTWFTTLWVVSTRASVCSPLLLIENPCKPYLIFFSLLARPYRDSLLMYVLFSDLGQLQILRMQIGLSRYLPFHLQVERYRNRKDIYMIRSATEVFRWPAFFLAKSLRLSVRPTFFFHHAGFRTQVDTTLDLLNWRILSFEICFLFGRAAFWIDSATWLLSLPALNSLK